MFSNPSHPVFIQDSAPMTATQGTLISGLRQREREDARQEILDLLRDGFTLYVFPRAARAYVIRPYERGKDVPFNVAQSMVDANELERRGPHSFVVSSGLLELVDSDGGGLQ